MYQGMGDFPPDEYSWYYGWEVLRPLLSQHADLAAASPSILVPGCGNDPLLLELYRAGHRRLTAFDYSAGAIERQRSLMEQVLGGRDGEGVRLRVEDARSLSLEWEESFDVVIEKGALDAVYLSGDGHFEKAAKELTRVIRRGGILVSVSGVVPEELRREEFGKDEWEWLRDGSDDLKAGCFVFKRR